MRRKRADLHKDFSGHPLLDEVRDILSKTEPSDLCKRLGLIGQSKEEFKEGKDSAVYTYDGFEVIDNLAMALRKSEVDLNEWEVSGQRFKTYTVTMKLRKKVGGTAEKPIYIDEPVTKTNYYCEIKFERRDRSIEELYNFLKDELAKDVSPINYIDDYGSGTGVVSLTDFHIGAEVKDLMRTPDFNIDILKEKLYKAAAEINALKYNQVHLNMLGDFVESLSGLNHMNTWKSLGKDMYGGKVLILAFQIIKECLLMEINNLVAVNVISGNHDRITMKSDVDNEGAGANLLAFMMQESMPQIDVDYNSMVLVKEIDGINYILCHGDKGMTKNAAKCVADFGRSDMYNVIIEGHLHTRKVTKTRRKTTFEYHDVQVVGFDDLNYRKIVAPSIFTGNYYSEGLGFSSTSGACITWNVGDNIKHLDIPL